MVLQTVVSLLRRHTIMPDDLNSLPSGTVSVFDMPAARFEVAN